MTFAIFKLCCHKIIGNNLIQQGRINLTTANEHWEKNLKTVLFTMTNNVVSPWMRLTTQTLVWPTVRVTNLSPFEVTDYMQEEFWLEQH